MGKSRIKQVSFHLHCKVESSSFTQVGLPLGGHPKTLAFWELVIDKIEKKLDRWRRFDQSRRWEINPLQFRFIKHSFILFVLFLRPSSVSKIVKRLMKSFFWEGNRGAIYQAFGMTEFGFKSPIRRRPWFWWISKQEYCSSCRMRSEVSE